MKLKIRIFLCCILSLLLGSGLLFAQDTKTIQEKKIASRTVYEYFVEEGLDEPVVESVERYNERGDLLEIKEFSKEGEVKRWEKFVYDKEGRLVEEVYLDEKGRIERKEKNLYAEGLRVEKQFYNNKDKLYKRKIYKYEYRK